MARIRYEVHGQQSEPRLIDELAAAHHRIGIDGLLRKRGRRARVGPVPAVAAVEGFRWGLLDGWSQRWWPQGIEVLEGRSAGQAGDQRDAVLLVSWYAQQRRGTTQGARITVVDRRDPHRLCYHHVLLVEPWREGSTIRMRPVEVHAGGLAVVDDRL